MGVIWNGFCVVACGVGAKFHDRSTGRSDKGCGSGDGKREGTA